MKELNVREICASFSPPAELLEAEGELVLSRRGQTIPRVLPIKRRPKAPSHVDLRKRLPQLHTSSAELIQVEGDAL